jgi:hypothetical protein
MTLYDSLVNFLNQKSDRLDSPEEYCPNCWGRQNYSNQFLEAIKTEHIDTNNVLEMKGWIQAYAIKHFEGLKVKQISDHLECPSCKVRYKAT